MAQPGPVLIDTQTAAGSSALAFVTGFDDTYDRYELEICSLKPANNGVLALLRVGTGAGPTWQTGANYRWVVNYMGANFGTGNHTSTAATSIQLASSNGSLTLGNGAGKNGNAIIRFNNPEASDFCEIHVAGSYTTQGDDHVSFWGGGRYNVAGAITGMQILLDSGNIASGVARLRGWPKT